MRKVSESKQKVVEQRTFELGGITYVPHYSKDCYVAPGYSKFTGFDKQGLREFFPDETKEFSAIKLLLAGAVETTNLLWPRPENKI